MALRSGLGLAALNERKEKEEEERRAKREAARQRRHNVESQKGAEDEQALLECEEQAQRDCEENARLRYEQALVVRIAVKFGPSGVWTKIAEARERGAELPLDPKRIYLLAHPDKVPLPEAQDATAILNAQRPPEMTAARPGVARVTTTSGASGSSSAGRPRSSATGARDPVDADVPPTSSAAPAATEAAAPAKEEERRADPDDGEVCTFPRLREKYDGQYSLSELEDYWRDECRTVGQSRRW